MLNQGESYSFDNWATQISPGIFEDDFRTVVSQEVDQNLTFFVDSVPMSAFENAPVLFWPNGTLALTTHAHFSGLVTLSIMLQDDGNEAFGGISKSESISILFEIQPRQSQNNR